jgi:hypothetical protein
LFWLCFLRGVVKLGLTWTATATWPVVGHVLVAVAVHDHVDHVEAIRRRTRRFEAARRARLR